MQTYYERWEEQRDRKKHFMYQRLYGLVIVLFAVLIAIVSTKTYEEFRLVAMVFGAIGLTVMLTKEKAIGQP